MPSIIPSYEYDIFISYRQNDNKRDGWVTEFVNSLKGELDATLKDKVSVYFDENPSDGLLETHHVDKSLEKKLKCLIFIPVISMTYCDTTSFAWQNEFSWFVDNAENDAIGMNIQLANGNVASRILPVKIHDIDPSDEKLIQEKLGSALRSIDFIYQGQGVNRPLRINELNPEDNSKSLNYRNQINKLANAIKELIEGAKAVNRVDKVTQAIVGETEDVANESFTQKVRQRDLVKVGLVYVIVSLVIWKTVKLASAIFALPALIEDIATIGLIAFMPVALLFAWLFERGPSGFIMTSSLAAKNNPYSSNQKKPLTGNVAILALLVVMLVLYFVPESMVPSKSISKSQLLENKSIAVLYFDNMSGDPEQEYFSDGITEEIIARLTKIEGIRVISRTSTRVYKGQPLNLKKIAKELNVSAVLEGSFRKSGDQIKVTAQLIDAETDEHIWAETFTRQLKDVFQVQAEIAHDIANMFEVDITPETDLKISEIPTKNLEAYEYFLRGKHLAYTQYYLVRDSSVFVKAKFMYEMAIKLDSQFAEAYAGLGDLYDEMRNGYLIRGKIKELPKEIDSLRYSLSRNAINLSPNSSFVNNTRAYTFLNSPEANLDSGFYYLKRAWQLDPNDAYYTFCLATFYDRHCGLYEQAFLLYDEALELNPLDPNTYLFLGLANYNLGNMEEGHRQIETEMVLRGKTRDWPRLRYYILTKNYKEAQLLIDNKKSKKEKTAYWEALLLGIQGKREEARIIIKENNIEEWRLFLAAEMKNEAIQLLKRRRRSSGNHYEALKNDPLWNPYRNDADFITLIDSAKVIHDSYLAKYGPFVDEFLKKIE